MTARPATRAPGPHGLELIRWIRFARRDTLAAMEGAVNEYGDIVRIHIPIGQGVESTFFLVRDPEDVKHVLQENHRNYRKSSSYEVVRLVVGDGLLTSEGEHWRRQRRLAQPAFHKQRIEHFSRAMVEETESMIGRWLAGDADEPLDIAEEMRRLTLAVVGRTLFSSDLGRHAAAVSRGLNGALAFADRRLGQAYRPPMWLPSRANRRFHEAMRHLDDVTAQIIESRRGQAGPFEDLLSMLMEAVDEDSGERMTMRQVRDEVMTFLLAGHETSANALGWSWHLLATHPEARERLEGEVDEALRGRPPTIEDLPRLPYARMVIEEALRLYPPVWMVERHAIGADVLSGYEIPAGAGIATSPYLTHRNPRVWEEPVAFRPERFAPGAASERRAFAYFPFGGGPRQCIGNTFALVETQLILATIAQRFRLDLAPGAQVRPEARVTLRPEGLRMTIRAREPAELRPPSPGVDRSLARDEILRTHRAQ